MNDVTRPSGLHWWAGPGQDLGTAFATVRSSPRVGEAVRALVGGMTELAESDPALLAIFKDAGRYSAAMWSFYLHETTGLTLPALRDLCTRTGLHSPGRVRALLQVLHYLRYVEPKPAAGRGLAYTMTPAFTTAWLAQLRAALSAAVVIEPEVAHLLANDEEVLRAFGRIHAEGYLAISDPSVVPGVIRVFLHAYAGSQVLWTLLCSSRDDRFPPEEAGPVSTAGLARRFDVGRVQVKRVFDAAASEGLASHDADGLVRFTAQAQQEIEFLYVIQVVQILRAAGAAAEVCGLLPTWRGRPGPGAAGC